MKQFQQPSRQYQSGVRVFDIPPSAQRKFTGADARFTRESWPNGVDYTLPDGNIVGNTVMVVRTLRTLDGQTWEQVDAATFPGGVLIHPRTGQVVLESATGIRFTDANGIPLAKDGDLRVEMLVLIPLRTALSFTMLEPGD